MKKMRMGVGLILLFGTLYTGAFWWNNASVQPIPEIEEESPQAAAPIENKLKVIEHTFRSGDSLFGVLPLLGVSAEEGFGLFKAARNIYDLRKVIPGRKIKIFFEEAPRTVAGLLYEIDPLRSLKIERSEQGFFAIEEKADLEREIAAAGGVISDTLFESALRADIPAEVILDLADIFAWDMDFSAEIQTGDRFQVVYEVYKKEGEIFRSGKILAAEIVNEGRPYRAYYFSLDGGTESAGGDYYDENGRSLKKAFLKSPLRYRYISSGFSTRRLHPILKVSRPHLGIDYAAPYGTPVMAAAEGVVTFVGWNGGHGKAVIVRHRNGYGTLYGHLSGYGKGIQKGKKVDQGEIIGRVGSTGLSTGPHLHYTLMKNGKPTNPKNADVVRGDPLSNTFKNIFNEWVQKMNRYLEPPRIQQDRV